MKNKNNTPDFLSGSGSISVSYLPRLSILPKLNPLFCFLLLHNKSGSEGSLVSMLPSVTDDAGDECGLDDDITSESRERYWCEERNSLRQDVRRKASTRQTAGMRQVGAVSVSPQIASSTANLTLSFMPNGDVA